jgi:hypothetical protein
VWRTRGSWACSSINLILKAGEFRYLSLFGHISILCRIVDGISGPRVGQAVFPDEHSIVDSLRKPRAGHPQKLYLLLL